MVYSIDDDGNIEFNEFLKLCKGKKRNKTHMKTEQPKTTKLKEKKEDDVIFSFFQQLTNGELQPSKDMKVGFNVYYSQERRKKLLDAILGGQDDKETKQGKKILDNYRLQLDEKMKKFKQDRYESLSQNGSVDDLEQFNFNCQRLEDFENNTVSPSALERLLDEMQQQRQALAL